MPVPSVDGSYSTVSKQNGSGNVLRAISATYTYFARHSKTCRNLSLQEEDWLGEEVFSVCNKN